MNLPPETVELDRKALDALIARVQHAIEHDLALSVEDMQLLLHAILTLCTLQEKMEQNDITLTKLRKLLGIIKQSERRSDENLNRNKQTSATKRKKQPKKNRQSSRSKPTVVYHKIVGFERGQPCAECNMGKLYKFEPATLLRITGHARFEAEQHISERLRCNACQRVYTAHLPESVLEDGDADQMYGYSARSLMVIDKFFSGLPYYHQGNLTDIFGYAVSASTIFDQCALVANAVMPVFYELKKQAAHAYQFLLDDTHNRILEQQPEMRDKPNGKGQQLRSGVYSSGLIAQLEDGHDIVLFETSLGHAGEHLESILKHRPPGLPPPLVMSDALSSNFVTQARVKSACCNAHARRQFYDLESLYPDEIGWVLDTYARIWKADDEAKEQGWSPKKRLAYHQEHSLVAMQEIKTWAETKQAAPDFEAHSTLGKAINYFLRHYDKLILFCIEPRALIDNNRMEEKLKLIIRVRKTAHFFKTANGAGVSNVLTSIIATTYGADENVYDYLRTLQQYADQLKVNPSAWLPWRYRQTVEEINAKSTADTSEK